MSWRHRRHCWGPYPVGASGPLPEIVAPAAAFRSATGFVRRRPTGSELGLAWDLPIGVLDASPKGFLGLHANALRLVAP